VRALILLLALLVPGIAEANKSVGLLVTGDVLKGPTQTEAEKWFDDHNQQVNTNALPKDAIKTLLDCFVIDDAKCSRGLVDARATTDSFVSIRIDVVSKKDKDVRLSVDWFVKGRAPVTARRTCEDCTEAVLRTTIDAMLLDLAKTSPGFMGRIKVTSAEAGIGVLVDNETIGVTPLERDITAGTHKARLIKDGRMGPEKDIKVDAGATAEIALEPPPAGGIVSDGHVPEQPGPVHHSRAVPYTMIGLGGAAVAAGAIMAFVLPKDPTVDDYQTRDWKTAGYITAGAGAVVAITGVIIILATPNHEGPTVSPTAGGGATIGWIGTF
jgi:hypothetical protein